MVPLLVHDDGVQLERPGALVQPLDPCDGRIANPRNRCQPTPCFVCVLDPSQVCLFVGTVGIGLGWLWCVHLLEASSFTSYALSRINVPLRHRKVGWWDAIGLTPPLPKGRLLCQLRATTSTNLTMSTVLYPPQHRFA